MSLLNIQVSKDNSTIFYLILLCFSEMKDKVLIKGVSKRPLSLSGCVSYDMTNHVFSEFDIRRQKDVVISNKILRKTHTIWIKKNERSTHINVFGDSHSHTLT